MKAEIKVTLTIGGIETELFLEDVKQLRDQLDDLLGGPRETIKFVDKSTPNPYYPWWNNGPIFTSKTEAYSLEMTDEVLKDLQNLSAYSKPEDSKNTSEQFKE